MKKKFITNYRENRYNYPLCDGNDRDGWDLRIKNSCRETDKEFFERLKRCGYRRLSLYETTTCIKGLHETIAYVKD